jgi:virulence factor Mce-like protein
MRGRRPTASIVASPILVGAITTLVVIVAVFLAYNANQGLPFVPTYDVNVNLPSASNLVRGNEVRIAGTRVGVVNAIKPGSVSTPKGPKPVAHLQLKLDQDVEPLPRDTHVQVRALSAIGLKYLEVIPGRSRAGFRPGDTVPLANSTKPVEFDDLLNTFTLKTREAGQQGLELLGNALAGRGPAINDAIQAFDPFFGHLTPVMQTLNDPKTRLDRLFPALAKLSGEVAPVSATNARVFSETADTLEAIAHDPEALRQTIVKSPQTEETAIASLRVQRPFLADFTDASRRLSLAADELAPSLPPITTALHRGRQVLPTTVDFNAASRKVFGALGDLGRNKETMPALRNLTTLTTLSGSLLEYAAPYQTVCNYGAYEFWSLFAQQDEEVPGGTSERVLLKSDNGEQTNRLSDSTSFRPVDVPYDKDPKRAQSAHGRGPLEALHGQPYSPAIDKNGNADCESGQYGYLRGVFGKGRTRPHNDASDFDQRFSGGSHVVVGPDTPGSLGPTFQGVPSLKDVP